MTKALSLGLKFLFVVAFILACVVALFVANGYIIDLKDRDIKSTGIVDIRSFNSTTADVRLDEIKVAESLPYQIKGLIAGDYKVDVLKVGYFPFSKKVRVINNFVKKIDEVLFWPYEIDKVFVQVKGLGTELSLMYMQGNVLAIFDKAKRTLYFYEVVDMKLVELAVTRVSSDDLKKVDLKDNIYYLEFGNGKRYLGNILGRELLEITLPNQFVFAGEGYLYGNGNLVFFENFNMKITKVFYGMKDNVRNIRMIAAKNSGEKYLLIRDVDDVRSLYLIDGDKLVRIVRGVVGEPIVSHRNGILFVDRDLGLVNFSVSKGFKFLGMFNGDSKLISWIQDYNYFMYEKGNEIYVRDLEGENVWKVDDKKYGSGGVLYYSDDIVR